MEYSSFITWVENVRFDNEQSVGDCVFATQTRSKYDAALALARVIVWKLIPTDEALLAICVTHLLELEL